jgi:hypothetical protein
MTEGVWPEGAELKSILPIPMVAEFSMFSASLMKACRVQKKIIIITSVVDPDPGKNFSGSGPAPDPK